MTENKEGCNKEGAWDCEKFNVVKIICESKTFDEAKSKILKIYKCKHVWYPDEYGDAYCNLCGEKWII